MNDTLEWLQDMLRVINGKKRSSHVNMTNLRRELKVFSINQLTCYHVLVETYNIVKFKSVEELYNKLVTDHVEMKEDDRETRSMARGDLRVPMKPKKKCLGFSWTAPKLWNKLPLAIRQSESPNSFKLLIKKWIYEGNVPV